MKNMHHFFKIISFESHAHTGIQHMPMRDVNIQHIHHVSVLCMHQNIFFVQPQSLVCTLMHHYLLWSSIVASRNVQILVLTLTHSYFRHTMTAL
jgi:hypothetical protein